MISLENFELSKLVLLNSNHLTLSYRLSASIEIIFFYVSEGELHKFNSIQFSNGLLSNQMSNYWPIDAMQTEQKHLQCSQSTPRYFTHILL